VNDRPRGKKQGGGNQNRRRRGNQNRQGGGGGNYSQQNQPRGPVITAIGESTYEAVFDHGNEGYGVWFDGQVREDPMYRQHWKGNRPIFVKLEDDRIVITRTRPGGDPDDDTADVGNAKDLPPIDAIDDLPSLGEPEANGANGAAEAEASTETEEKPAPKRRTTRRKVTIDDDDQPAVSSDDIDE
jgi:hypothetical protein